MSTLHVWKYASNDPRYAYRKASDSSRGESLWGCIRCGAVLVHGGPPSADLLVIPPGSGDDLGVGARAYTCDDVVVLRIQDS